MVLRSDPFDLHRGQPLRAERQVALVAVAAQIDEYIQSESVDLLDHRGSGSRAENGPSRGQLPEAAVYRVSAVFRTDRVEFEFSRVEILEAGNREPADRMGLQ